MRRLFAVLVMGWIGSCASGDGDEDESLRRSCERLRDHVVELRLVGQTDPVVNVDHHRTALKRALGDDFVASCEQRMSHSEIMCGLAATELGSVSGCSKSTSQ